jgi:hypothetical protein
MAGCAQDKSIPMPIDSEIGYVVYMSKRLEDKSFPLKAFVVRKDTSLLKRIHAKLKEYEDGIRLFRAEGGDAGLPAVLHDCSKTDYQGYRAKTCPAVGSCKAYATERAGKR